MTDRYAKQKILLATKHQKEQAIAPIFLNELDAKIIVSDNFDTDQFGTFSGEIKRERSPQETCIQKAKQAALLYDFDYVIASEGSFGPHPHWYFVPADIEIMAFVDLKNDLVITEQIISENTNYSYKEITINDEYEAFLKEMAFPTHGLVLRDLTDDKIIAKGVQSESDLKTTLMNFFNQNDAKKVRLETDMRAMMNPTRMSVIGEVTKQLVTRLKSYCPACQSPGFGVKSVDGKLPCQCCGAASTLYRYIVQSCISCDYQEKNIREDGIEYADPSQCVYCNP